MRGYISCRSLSSNMINRQLIRIKVLQVLYNFYRVEGMTTDRALQVLDRALESSYRLYIYLCGLPMQISDLAEDAVEVEEGRFNKRPEILEVLKHLRDNRYVEYIRRDEKFRALYDEVAPLFARREIDVLLRTALQQMVSNVLAGDPVKWNDIEANRRIWREQIEEVILRSEDFMDALSLADFYLNDDIAIVYSFVIKVLNARTTDTTFGEIVKPQYTDDEVRDFADTLLSKTIEHKDEYRARISTYFKNWDPDRVSEMDYLILQLAMTEAIQFPTIATRVTINEYLNLSHDYSGPKHYTFTNGILHSLFTDLKAEGIILGE